MDQTINRITLLFDSFSQESRNLYESFKNSNIKVNTVVIDDDGFLPDDVISPFGYFLGDFKSNKELPGKPLFFNQIKIPRYWEIASNSASGQVLNLDQERARIYFAKPTNTRLVQIVDWLDEKGIVRLSEHYNKYGACFCKTIFNHNGAKVSKSYFDANGKNVIDVNFVTNDYIVRHNGKEKILHSQREFVYYFIKCAGLEQTAMYYNSLGEPFFTADGLPDNGSMDALFWNEPIADSIPGNMKYIFDGNGKRVKKVYVQSHETYEKLLSLGAPKDMLVELGYIYSFERENEHRLDALICTNSDQVIHLAELAEGLPEIHFHVCALTEMSSRLESFDNYDNISLYPNARYATIDKLFTKCDLYLDINRESEIVDAVHRAFLNNMLIFGFNSVLHNRTYTSPTNIFAEEEYVNMIEVLSFVVKAPQLIDMALEQQYNTALSADIDMYKQTFDV